MKKWFLIDGKIDILLPLILIGTVLRFSYPFLFSPLKYLHSDPSRHYLNATAHFNNWIYSWLDPPVPQFCLRWILSLSTNKYLAISIFFGLLCAATPWIWYLWGRQIFTSEKKARIFLLVLIILPSWLAIYRYVMDETMLLPALGLALWLSWCAQKRADIASLIWATLGWSLALSIKLNVLFELIIIFPWLIFSYFKRNGVKAKSFILTLVCLSCLLVTYLIYPLWCYQGLKTTWIYPPSMGAMTRAYYLSSCASHSVSFVRGGAEIAHTGLFGADIVQNNIFEPFGEWHSSRKGNNYLIVNCDQKVFFGLPMPKISIQKRFDLMVESILCFLFDPAWPDSRLEGIINIAQIETRWIWSLLVLFILGLAWQKNRFTDVVVILSLGTALLYVLSDIAPLEGRYRKPWEGVAIATFIFLYNAPTKKIVIHTSKLFAAKKA